MRRRRRFAVVLLAAATASALAATGAGAVGTPAFHPPARADDPAIGGTGLNVNEPATIIGADGTRYVAYQLGSQLSYTRDGGQTWTYAGGADAFSKHVTGCTSNSDIGDVELAADQTGRVWAADLQITSGGTGDNGIQPVVARSDDRFATYQGVCAAHQPASVDREWLAAYAGDPTDPDKSDLYLSYHDFGPNFISVNASHDGGKTWGLPVPVVDNANAAAASGCDTVPAGTAVDPRNGWVYVAWTSGDNPASNATTGCNYTQGTVFNKFWVSVSKDKGATWHTSLAYAGANEAAAQPDDMSEIFGWIAVDRQGGVYVTFPSYKAGEYDVYVAHSPPAGATNNLTFSAPLKVNPPTVKTAYFTRLVAGDSGRIDVIYLGTAVQNVAATP